MWPGQKGGEHLNRRLISGLPCCCFRVSTHPLEGLHVSPGGVSRRPLEGAQGLVDGRCPKEVILKDILKWGCHPTHFQSLLSQPYWTWRTQPRTLFCKEQKALCSLPLNLGGSDCHSQLRFKVVCSHSVLTDERPQSFLLVCREGLLV